MLTEPNDATTAFPSTRRPGRRRRGYLLIEVLVAGTILTSTIMGLIISLNRIQQTTIITGREAVSQQLVVQGLERMRSLGYTNVDGMGSPITENNIWIGNNKYNRSTAWVSLNEPTPDPAVTIDLKEITVMVNFTAANGKVYSQQSAYRLYEGAE